MFKSPMTCMAMCEIIDKKEDFTYHPGKKGQRQGLANNAIYVVPKEEFVVTRFFFVNPVIQTPGSSNRTAAGVTNGTAGNSFEVMKEAAESGRLGFLSNRNQTSATTSTTDVVGKS